MGQFDVKKVLEKILEEAPTLSNLRKLIPKQSWNYVKETFEKVKDGGLVPIYAHYYNRDVTDPDLNYHRVNQPAKTKSESTLCEVYSFWEGDPNVQKLIERLTGEGKIKPGDVMHQGPWLEGAAIDDKEIIEETRRGSGYSFHHSASTFQRHFNKICEELGYEPRLVDMFNEVNTQLYGTGSQVVEVPRSVALTLNGKHTKGEIKIRAPLGINLSRVDPTLIEVLKGIGGAYERILTVDLASADPKVDLSLWV